MNKVPRHVGIIMDGNRRFAKKLLLKPWMGHEWGAKKIHKILDWSQEQGIKEITFYAFSVQNFNRPNQEFEYLMEIFCKEFDGLMQTEKQKELTEKGIRLNFIGRLNMFPEKVYSKMLKLMEMTAKNKEYTVNFAMAYGGREEVIDAVHKIAQQIKKGELDVESINEKTFAQNLYLNSDPDLVIRTGGEKRTSNFLTWQSTYSELIFLDKGWPEIEKEDYLNAIQEYSERERRFGR